MQPEEYFGILLEDVLALRKELKRQRDQKKEIQELEQQIMDHARKLVEKMDEISKYFIEIYPVEDTERKIMNVLSALKALLVTASNYYDDYIASEALVRLYVEITNPIFRKVLDLVIEYEQKEKDLGKSEQ